MRHLAIATLALAAACGGTSDNAGTTTPVPDPEPEVAPAPTDARVVNGRELTENEVVGVLVGVELADETTCFVQLQLPGNDAVSWFDAEPAVCGEDLAAVLGRSVILFRPPGAQQLVQWIEPVEE